VLLLVSKAVRLNFNSLHL